MKKVKKLLSIVMVVMMVFSVINFVNVRDVSAAARVKSLKVKGAKKKVTLQVGQKKTYKVKIKASKKNKKFTVKSSKKKIVKVTKKKNKIVVKALKVGKSKITVKSKANKKKKYSFTVIVKAKKDSSKKNTPAVENTLKARALDNNIFVLEFSKAKEIKVTDLALQTKENSSAPYKTEIKIKKLYTDDNTVYTAVLDSNVPKGGYAKFTVVGTNISAECLVELKPRPKNREIVRTIETNKEINLEVSVDETNKPYVLKTQKDIPQGVNCTFNKEGTISVSGQVSEAGIYKMKFAIEDSNKVVNNFTVTLVAGNKDYLIAYVTEDEGYAYNKDGHVDSYMGLQDVYVSGGSGYYSASLYGDADNAFTLEESGEEDKGHKYYIISQVDEPGEYKAVVSVVDDQDVLATSADVKLNVKEELRVTGKVTTPSGALVNGGAVAAVGIEDTVFFKGGSIKSDGTYELFVMPGVYNFIADSLDDAEGIVPNKKVDKDNTVINITIDDLYVIKIKKPEGLTVNFERWYLLPDEDLIGSGDVLVLKKGKYKIESPGYAYYNGQFYNSTATIDIDLQGDVEVTPAFNMKSVTSGGELQLGTTVVEIGDSIDGNFYVFKPKESGLYRFAGAFSGEDSVIDIYDDEFGYFAEFDDDEYEADGIADTTDFDGACEMEAGKTYFINIWLYSDQGSYAGNGTLTITKIPN